MSSNFSIRIIANLFFAFFITTVGLVASADDEAESGEEATEESTAVVVSNENDLPEGDSSSAAAPVSNSTRLPASLSSAVPAAAPPPDFEDFLESQTQEQPSDSLGLIQVRTAGSFGFRVDGETYSKSEYSHGPAMGMNFDNASALSHDSGFMRRGMDQYFSERIVANVHVLNLFQRFSHLRSGSGISLPSAFATLTNFIEQYIKANSLGDAESNNGFSHRTLAVQVVRASFCFGNDPFMILAKMRRETNFSRRSVSPTGAVGFSQMTGMGVKEVQHQMSGNPDLSLPAARTAFQQAVRCFSGIRNYEIPPGGVEEIKNRIRQKWGFDMVFGQILVKTLVSNAKATNVYGNNTGGVVAAYEDAFTVYNGDTQKTRGVCTGKASVQMREEYACDVISQFNKLSAQWNRFVLRSTGKDLT